MKNNKANSSAIVGGNGVTIAGNIESSIDMIIRSNITGDINSSSDVTIEADASIVGNIKAAKVVIDRGTLSGNIIANNVVLGEHATVTGDIETVTIEVLPGALFNGKCNAHGNMAVSQSETSDN